MSIARLIQQAATATIVQENNLANAWTLNSVTSLAAPRNDFRVTSQDTNPSGVFFKPDGTKMYMVGATTDTVYEYDLATAWDVFTASFLQLFSIASQESIPQGLFFKPDGTKMYIFGNAGRDVNEYDLSTAWDISSAVFLQLFSVSAQEVFLSGLFFKPDGLKMYIIGNGNDVVYEYYLSTAWSVSSASRRFPTTGYYSVAAQESSSPWDLFFKPDGTKMYMVGSNGTAVYEYDLATAWNISSAVFLQSFNVVAQDTFPVSVFFKPDGTKMYVLGLDGLDVNEYDLSTAWDISSASFLQLFSIAAQENNVATGVFFKPDGLKMYMCGSGQDTVNEYDLSTAWDISSASFLQLFSIVTQEGNSADIFFKPDGTKMYIVGSSGDDVNEYDLSTAWDISSSTFIQLFSIAGEDFNPTSVSFKPDGTKMYMLGSDTRAVWEYSLI